MKENNQKKAWVLAVNMGYGHQRTAYPLKELAVGGKIINANDYEGIPEGDKKIWESTRRFYEFMSDFKKVPLVGNFAFYIYNKFQEIPTFYPRRDLSRPTLSLRKVFSMIENGWGRDLILGLKDNSLPLISTFFIPAFMAEVAGYPGDIFCVICDADISRSWVSLDPKKSKIKYFAPNSWVVDRLKLYGVKEENIFLTGYPLPKENIGTKEAEILKKDVASRILNLDPKGEYRNHYDFFIKEKIGIIPEKTDRPFTIIFSIGGAGAQKEIAMEFVRSLAKRIKKRELKIFLSAGIRENVKTYFEKKIKKFGFGDSIEIIFDQKIENYFRKFNEALRKSDVLWTKPSELSFYSGLGIPIIIAPTIGSQEDFNKKWLLRIGGGFLQESPRYAHQWIFDYLNGGRFAEAAMEGFIEVEKFGAYNIQKICFGGPQK